MRNRFRGVIIGTAVGDSLGLPAEGLSRRRSEKMLKGPWRHRLLFGRGMVSDDTEHTIFVAQSLICHGDSDGSFSQRLARSFRFWLLSLPAGVGLATLRSIMKLWVGFGPGKSGVFSAGNGPAMRVGPIGAFFHNDPARLEKFVKASTIITHTDPKAIVGAMAVAKMVAWSIENKGDDRPGAEDFIGMLLSVGADCAEWQGLCLQIKKACHEGLSVVDFADSLGLSRGVTGYMYHTVPVALYAWWNSFGDFEKTLLSVFSCGGDTDTTGAIAGAIAGSVTGERGIPEDWINRIIEWPRGVTFMEQVADALYFKAKGESPKPVKCFWPGVIPRNLFFLWVVLLHGLRRLLPPY